MILNFSFIKVSADDKNTVNDSQDNLVKEQLRQLAKEALDTLTIFTKKEEEFNKASTESIKILEKCENTDAKVEFDNINIDLNNKFNEILNKSWETSGQNINTKYNFKLEPEKIEKCKQISSKILEGKTECITTLTNKEAEFVKIVTKIAIEKTKIGQTFINNSTIATNNLKERIKSAKTAENPKTEITQAISEYKKKLEEKFKELKRNIEKTVKTDEKEKHEKKHEKTDKPFYKKIWFWATLTTLTTLTILIIASCGFFIYKKNKKSKIKKT